MAISQHTSNCLLCGMQLITQPGTFLIFMEWGWCVNKAMNCSELPHLKNLPDSQWWWESMGIPSYLLPVTIATSLSGRLHVSLERTRVYQATAILLWNFRPISELYLMDSGHLGQLVGEFNLGPESWYFLSCTVTKFRSVYQAILLLFPDFLPGLPQQLIVHRHFSKASFLPSDGFYSSTWACYKWHTSLFVLSFHIYCRRREKSIAYKGHRISWH